jgi:hypothetical protein
MKTDKEFDNILDECLEKLLVEGATLEQCLQRYPEQAPELEPLLQTALEAKEASAIQPRAEFKARARYQFRSALGETASRRSRSFLAWLPGWATVVTIVLVVLLAGGSTVVMAGNSMPDSPLYSVKLATEEARLVLTPSEIGKARLCAELVDRRVEEIIYMAAKGDALQVELVTQRLDERLEKLAVLVSALGGKGEVMLMAPSVDEEASGVEEAWGGQGIRAGANEWSELKMKVASYAAENQAALLAILEKAPGSVKSALRRAIAVSLAGYQKALEALD